MSDVADGTVAPLTPIEAGNRPEALDEVARLASHAQMLAIVQRMAVHDFNDSLNSLTLNVELLARIGESDATPEKKTEVTQRCVNSMRQELKRLALATGKALGASSQQREAAPTRVSLAGLVDDVIAGVRNQAHRRHVSVSFPSVTGQVEVMGFRDELRLAIFNLAANALDAMPDGGELSFELDSESKIASLAISNTGAGVGADIRERMWDLFFSTKPDGLGLGLHVVRSIVAKHGGTVTVEARDSSAVTFVIRLPLVQ